MYSIALYLFAAATAGLVAAVPTPHYVARHASKASLKGLNLINGKVKANSYIVKLNDTADRDTHMTWATGLVANSTSTNATSALEFSASTFNGYAAELDDDAVEKLLASSDVAWIEEDGIMNAFGVETNAPWGLERISQADTLPPGSDPTQLDFTYNFADDAGKGVDVYVIDTGILVSHTDYGGRATFAFSAPGLAKTDDNGHGSHCAGTIAGTQFGVAKAATLMAVKVLASDGSGATSDILSGINFAIDAASKSGRPSVISMSLGGTPSRALDRAVQAAVTSGVTVVVAAGNESQDAANVSPARVPDVITVGAIDIDDTRAFFSNFGTTVDVFAPGVSITSVGIKSNTDTETLDGTSMSCPHVSGIVAAMLSQNPTLTPAQIQAQLKSTAVSGKLAGLPRTTSNLVAQVDAGSSSNSTATPETTLGAALSNTDSTIPISASGTVETMAASMTTSAIVTKIATGTAAKETTETKTSGATSTTCTTTASP